MSRRQYRAVTTIWALVVCWGMFQTPFWRYFLSPNPRSANPQGGACIYRVYLWNGSFAVSSEQVWGKRGVIATKYLII